jgi:hypothetical protein
MIYVSLLVCYRSRPLINTTTRLIDRHLLKINRAKLRKSSAHSPSHSPATESHCVRGPHHFGVLHCPPYPKAFVASPGRRDKTTGESITETINIYIYFAEPINRNIYIHWYGPKHSGPASEGNSKKLPHFPLDRLVPNAFQKLHATGSPGPTGFFTFLLLRGNIQSHDPNVSTPKLLHSFDHPVVSFHRLRRQFPIRVIQDERPHLLSEAV